MALNLFETRQRAEELMERAAAIWKASDRPELLEGLEQDPVFAVLMTALAYQANEIDGCIEHLKTEILEEFDDMLRVGEASHAVPATVCVRTASSAAEPVRVDHSLTFTHKVGERSFPFMPVLDSTVYAVSHIEIQRLDGRRWRVGLDFPYQVGSLGGLTFAVSDLRFRELEVTCLQASGEQLDLIAPWDAANQPMSVPFSLDTLLYNRKHAVRSGGARGNLSPFASNLAMDLFAAHDVLLFSVARGGTFPLADHVDLVFEFHGVKDGFELTADVLTFNVLLLANAECRSCQLSDSEPVVRICGDGRGSKGEQFLHLLRPANEQIYATMPLQVRRVAADRFNRGRLVKLVSNLITRYHSDYYAFQSMGGNGRDIVSRLRGVLRDILAMSGSRESSFEGVYLTMEPVMRTRGAEVSSLTASYLVTHGAGAGRIRVGDAMGAPALLDEGETRVMAVVLDGKDEVRDEVAERSLAHYHMATADRLVTPSDLKLFCYNELQTRYSIVPELIQDIRVGNRRLDSGQFHTYAIQVEITIRNNAYIRRSMMGRLATAEVCLEKMMQARSANIYPIVVKMRVQE